MEEKKIGMLYSQIGYKYIYIYDIKYSMDIQLTERRTLRLRILPIQYLYKIPDPVAAKRISLLLIFLSILFSLRLERLRKD